MTPAKGADVLVVGGGASGTLLITQLLQRASGLRILWCDRDGAFARGLAYGAAAPIHLLNVPASGMSAFPDRPSDFVDFCRRAGRAVDPGDFLPRRLYGDYLAATYEEARRAARGAEVEAIAAGVARILPEEGGHRVLLDDGAVLRARHVVLACGNAPPAVPLGAGGRRIEGTISPWDARAIEAIDPAADVLLLGTGLTMIDLALLLEARGLRGRMVALSRHGLLPQAHAPHPTKAPPVVAPRARSLRGLVRDLRARIDRADDWREVIDGLRSQTPALWGRLSLEDRRRFLRHLRPYWEVHRHRLPPVLDARIRALREAGRLEVHAGRLLCADRVGDAVEVVYRERGGTREHRLRVGAVINCTGPACGIRNDPFLRQLVADGVAAPDPIGLGVRTSGGLLHRGPSGCVWAIGPLRRPELYESTAIPEIRRQAVVLAERLLRSLGRMEGAAVCLPC